MFHYFTLFHLTSGKFRTFASQSELVCPFFTCPEDSFSYYFLVVFTFHELRGKVHVSSVWKENSYELDKKQSFSSELKSAQIKVPNQGEKTAAAHQTGV